MVGFKKKLLLPCCFFVTVSGLYGAHEVFCDSLIEFTDNEYAFAFQYPSSWKMEKPPKRGEAGEVRVLIKSPNGIVIMATVGDLDMSVPKDKYVNNPNKEAAVEALINYTVEGVYKKTSKDLNATRMLVAEKKQSPCDLGIRFYISTVHALKKGAIVMSGLHTVPFEKRVFSQSSGPNWP